jgi:hypothetical protein
MKTRTTAIRRAIADSAADIKLLDQAVTFDRRITEIQRALRGNETLRGLESGSPSTIQSRVNSAAAGARGLTGAPTGTQQMNYSVANDQLNAEAAKLRARRRIAKVRAAARGRRRAVHTWAWPVQ